MLKNERTRVSDKVKGRKEKHKRKNGASNTMAGLPVMGKDLLCTGMFRRAWKLIAWDPI
jgi:hypothetical protein